MLRLFAKYTSVGVLSTLIHWVVFGVCIYATHANQALADFVGFVMAASFSFFTSAKFTFEASTTTIRYMLYIRFMGTPSTTVGWTADKYSLPPIITLITSSTINLVYGFVYSGSIVFRDAK